MGEVIATEYALVNRYTEYRVRYHLIANICCINMLFFFLKIKMLCGLVFPRSLPMRLLVNYWHFQGIHIISPECDHPSVIQCTRSLGGKIIVA